VAIMLAEAAKDGDYSKVVELLASGLDPNRKHSGQTPLIYACENGHDQIAQVLLDNGAYVDARDRYGQTALHWCARNGQGRCAQLLVSRGADTTIESRLGETPVSIARQRVNLDVTRAILHKMTGDFPCEGVVKAGLNPNRRTSQETPLRNSVRSGTTPTTTQGPTPVAKATPEPELPPTSVETKSNQN